MTKSHRMQGNVGFSRREFIRRGSALAASAAVVGGVTPAARAAAGWATLRGRIVYDGTPPVPEPITVTKDKDVCGTCDLYDETLLVDPDSHGLKNVVVRLYVGRRDTIEIHESYEKDKDRSVLMQSQCCHFVPHVVAMRTTQKFVFRNADPKGDALKIDPFRNPGINVTLTPREEVVNEFPRAERVPAKVTCPVHPWELGWLVICDHPYVAVSNKDGHFKIQNVPVGEHRFMFWQEKAGYLSDVTVQGRQESWRRGTKELALKPGDNDLGDIVVQPSLFEK